jgi:PAS domain-containing protein
MTLFRKNIVTLGLVAFGLSGILVILALAFMSRQYNKTNSEALLGTAKVLIAAVGEDRIGEYCAGGGQSIDADLDNSLEIIRVRGNYRLSLIDAHGEVLWDSAAGESLVNHLDRSEVQAALEGREGIAQRDSLSTGMRQIYAALPVYNSGGSIAGVFRLSITVPHFSRRIAPVALPFLVCAILLAFTAFAAITAFSRSLAGSLKRLVDIAETATGKTDSRDHFPIAIPGETEELLALETALQRLVAELSRRAEEAEKEGRQLHAILNGMSEAVLAMDNNLILYLANPRACALFGLGNVHGSSLLEATRSTELE